MSSCVPKRREQAREGVRRRGLWRRRAREWRPGGARLQKKADATRRSITWLAYLNDDWDPKRDGGQLRLHERAQPSSHVGALDTHLQVGWLRATAPEGEQPVFLDPFRGDAESESCMLFTRDANGKTPADTSPPESGAGRKARVERKASAVERGGVGKRRR